MAIEVMLALCLPQDASTVPFARHIARYAMEELGVTPDCIYDVEVALTEACANVIRHAESDDEYEIQVSIGEDQCELRVKDTGRGFDVESLSERTDGSAERGRGVALMRALVDTINFDSDPESGTVVHLVKRLSFGRSRPSFLGE